MKSSHFRRWLQDQQRKRLCINNSTGWVKSENFLLFFSWKGKLSDKKRWNFPCHRVRVNVVITFLVCKFPLLLCALLTVLVTSLPCSIPRTLSQIARTTNDTSNQRFVVRHWTFPTFCFFLICEPSSLHARLTADRLLNGCPSTLRLNHSTFFIICLIDGAASRTPRRGGCREWKCTEHQQRKSKNEKKSSNIIRE